MAFLQKRERVYREFTTFTRSLNSFSFSFSSVIVLLPFFFFLRLFSFRFFSLYAFFLFLHFSIHLFIHSFEKNLTLWTISWQKNVDFRTICQEKGDQFQLFPFFAVFIVSGDSNYRRTNLMKSWQRMHFRVCPRVYMHLCFNRLWDFVGRWACCRLFP